MSIDEQAAEKILQGARAWNAWRAEHPGPISFTKPHWYKSPGPAGMVIKGGNQLDFSGMDLSDVSIYKAFAEGLNLRDATFVGAHFEEGDFSRVDFRDATFRNTRFNKTIFTNAVFDGATFVNCNLNRVNLVGASFRVREITETVVYGTAAWDIETAEDTRQSRLVIEQTYELYSDLVREDKVPMMVDNLELAQFVYPLINHKKMRDALNELNNRGVLLLGRFRDGGLERLYALRERLLQKGYMPMIFDFARPDNLSLTETIVTMAGLSKFVVVDLSGGSVPGELQSIFGQIKKPMLAFGDPYAMFPDLADQTRVLTIEREDDLWTLLDDRLDALERLHADRVALLERRYTRADRERLSDD